jgi:putative transposase
MACEEGLGNVTQSCRALRLARSNFYRAPKARVANDASQREIIDLSQKHPRYGYRRITALLRRQGKPINAKRVQRIRRVEGLQVRKKQRRSRRLDLSSSERRRATTPNEVWSWDLVHDQIENGSTFRILSLIDEHTKECLALHVGWSIRATDAIEVIEQTIQRYGQPAHLRSDNGPEFIAYAITDWMKERGVSSLYIKPGAPWEQAYVESFHDKFRDECLNREVFGTLAETRVIVESWRNEYNQRRPHSALGYRTPNEFAAQCRKQTLDLVANKPRRENGKHALGFDHARPQCATYPQSPSSGPARCSDVTDLCQAFSHHAAPGRLGISLDPGD